MNLNGKPLQDVSEADFIALIADSVTEGKTLDYKVNLPGNSDDEKKEFLADVSSFANTAGGFLIFGMTEDGGIAKSLPGISCVDPDGEVLRLEGSIRDGIQPRIAGINTKYIELANNKYAFLISIQQSWLGPHMVTYKTWSRFYCRNSAGKYPLDVHEIRQAFLMSDNLTTRIRNFHLERLSKVLAGETSVLIPNGAKIIMHFIPVISYQANNVIDVKNAGNNYFLLETLSGAPHTHRHNLDGLVTSVIEQEAISYTQLFRNGIIETVDGYILRDYGENRLNIPSIYYEHATIEISKKFLRFLEQSDIIPPIQIFISLSGVKGYTLAISPELQRRYMMREIGGKVDRDILTLPDIMLENYDEENLEILFRPVFDGLWNASGWPECLDYDVNGNLKIR